MITEIMENTELKQERNKTYLQQLKARSLSVAHHAVSGTPAATLTADDI